MFKICNVCDVKWNVYQDFLGDKNITLIGYQNLFEDPDEGLFLFNHSCETTLAITALEFANFYNHISQYAENKNNTIECKGLCLDVNNLEECDTNCKYAHIRKGMQFIKNYKKVK